MATSFKSLELLRTFQSKLKVRLAQSNSTLTVHDIAFDTDSNPFFLIDDGSPATTEKNVCIKLSPEQLIGAKDVLGNTAFAYTPSIIQIATEATAAGGGQTFLDAQMMLNCFLDAAALGCKFEWWQETNGTVPSTTTFTTAAKLKASYRPDAQYQMISQQ